MDTHIKSESYFALFLRFLRFGFLAWGGPVAQINMIREELVVEEKWITPDKFKRVLAIYQALPGPEAHELCVYFGMIRKGRWGGFLAGLGFMLPGFIMILLLAHAYRLYGATVLLPLFIGVAPAVTALIIRALHKLGEHNLSDKNLWLIAVGSALLCALEVHFLLIFLLCGLWQFLRIKLSFGKSIGFCLIVLSLVLWLHYLFPPGRLTLPFTGGLFMEGLKAGLLSFGGAYTAIPFLNDSMVGHYEGITQKSFIDAIALSGIIPAPLVIFGTFLGYIADGVTGALLMTLGIFIPAFSFTLLGHGYLEKIIDNSALHSILEGISAAVIGLLSITAAKILLVTVTDLPSALIFIVALTGLYTIRKKWVIPMVIIVCGVLGHVF